MPTLSSSSARSIPERLKGRQADPSEARAELPADDARVVDDAGQVVEVDGVDVVNDIGAVAAEHRHVVLVIGPGVAQAQPTQQQRRAIELPGRIEEVIESTAIGPVGVAIELAA